MLLPPDVEPNRTVGHTSLVTAHSTLVFLGIFLLFFHFFFQQAYL